MDVIYYTHQRQLLVDLQGKEADREGKHWQFLSNKLKSNESYELQILSEDEAIYKRWSVKTFPDPETEIKKLSFMSFTCPGGGDAFRASGREFFKPFSFRQNRQIQR